MVIYLLSCGDVTPSGIHRQSPHGDEINAPHATVTVAGAVGRQRSAFRVMMRTMQRTFFNMPCVVACLAAAALGVGFSAPTHAGDTRLGERLATHAAPPGASAWDVSMASRLRLVAAQTSATLQPGETALAAGVEISLDKNWKTYWSTPGDTGIAPMFDFSRSTNVASVGVSYPMPQRFDLPGDISFGYEDRVVFPLTVTPQVPGAPVVLAADVVYGACEELCIPVEAKAQLTFAAAPAATTRFANDIARWRERVPAAHGAILARVEPITDNKGARLVIDVNAPAAWSAPTIIAELVDGPARAYLGTPSYQPDGSHARFVFPVKIHKGGPGLHGGATLAITVADGAEAVAAAEPDTPMWAQHFEYVLPPQ